MEFTVDLSVPLWRKLFLSLKPDWLDLLTILTNVVLTVRHKNHVSTISGFNLARIYVVQKNLLKLYFEVYSSLSQ